MRPDIKPNTARNAWQRAFAAALLSTTGALSGCSHLNPFHSSSKPPETLEVLTKRHAQIPADIPIDDAENRAHEHYAKFLDQPSVDPKLAAEATRRLGDLELESGEAADLGKGPASALLPQPTQHSAAQIAANAAAAQPGVNTSPAVDALSASTYAAAIARYEKLLKQYPNYAHNDLVLYQLARALESGGDPVGALARLDEIVKRYPQTPMLAEVQFRRGEILFSRSRYEDAESAYAAVLALEAPHPPGTYTEQSLYKQGWSRFKQDQYQEGLEAFYKLLDGRLSAYPITEVDGQMEKFSRPVRELLDDSLRVMALSYSLLDGEKTLRQSLAKHGQPSYSHLLYQSLADLYIEQKRYADSADVLLGFVDAQPLHPRAPFLHMRAVAVFEQGKFPSEALGAREKYIDRFGLERDFWKTHAGNATVATLDDPAYKPALDFLRESVWMLAQQAHALAQAESRAKQPNTAVRETQYKLAAERYQRYLTYFPQDERAPNVQFLLGEVQFERGDYAAAVTAYEAAAYNYPAHARSAESAYAALLGYQKHETSLQADAKTAWHRRFLDAELKFADHFPTDKRAVAVRVDAAQGLLAAGAKPEAIAAAQPATTAADASPEQQRLAWMVIGQGSFDGADFATAETAFVHVREIDQHTGKKDPELDERIAAAIYRQAEAARSAGQTEQAAANFLRVAQAAPASKIRTTADYDAAQTYLAAGQSAAAIPVLESFRSQHPDSPLVGAATASLALAYLKTNNTAAAAQEFEKIADTASYSPAERQEALQQATKLYHDRHDDLAEARTLNAFIKRYPEAHDSGLEARQRMIEIASTRKDSAARLAWSKDLITYENSGPHTDRSRYLAAHAALNLAEPTQLAFSEIPLTAPLKNSFHRKKDAMETALAAYGKAADYGVADVMTESAFQIAELYRNLAKSLNDSERPKNLDAQAAEQYDLIIQEQAYPFEEKAIELHEANAARAKDGIYDQWVRASYEQLAKLVPGRYARENREERYVDAIR